MVYDNIREFISVLEKEGELARIKTEVDAELEIAEITDRVSKEKGTSNKALLFERVKGSSFPVLTNVFGSMKRMCLALGVNNLDEIGGRIKEIVDPTNLFPGPGAGIMDKLQMLPKLTELSSFFPKTVKKAPCQEVVLTGDQVDLSKIPVLKCWPADGGRFITLPMVCTVDPVTSITNVGMYRMQVFDHQTTGMHWHKHKDGARHYQHYETAGKRMEVAVAIGGDPSIIYASTAPLPPVIGEYLFAGFLRRKQLEVVQCKTVNVRVPAEAEFILEGFVDPLERQSGGPFRRPHRLLFRGRRIPGVSYYGNNASERCHLPGDPGRTASAGRRLPRQSYRTDFSAAPPDGGARYTRHGHAHRGRFSQ